MQVPWQQLSELPGTQLKISRHDPFSSLQEGEFNLEGDKFISFKKYEAIFCTTIQMSFNDSLTGTDTFTKHSFFYIFKFLLKYSCFTVLY